jgi:AcrR family transcriptional regulator
MDTMAKDRGSAPDVRARLLLAGRAAFASVGFEGASLRGIATTAGVGHTLLLYHFKTKDALWRAVMADILDDLESVVAERLESLGDGSGGVDAARALVEDFVHFCARRPELHRIMTIEGRIDSDRLAWLVDRYSQPTFERVRLLIGSSSAFADAPPIQWYYAAVGLAASPFTLAPEYRRLSGENPFAPDVIARHARFVDRLLFERAESTRT